MDNIINKIYKYQDENKHQEIIDIILNLPQEKCNDELLELLIIAYNSSNQFEKSIEILENMNTNSQKQPKFYYILGDTLLHLGKYEKAEESLKCVLSLSDISKEILDNCNSLLDIIHKKNEDRKNKIKPFFWVEHDSSFSVCLNVGKYLQDVFDTRADEGFEGGGYDWASLAYVFLDEQCPELKDVVRMDPEGSMFVAYSKDSVALYDFITRFKNACENKTLILDLFSRAELD